MSRIGYFDRSGIRISEDLWRAKQGEPEYVKLAEFDNGTVRVFAMWHGRVINPQNYLSTMLPIFMLQVSNYDGNGVLRPDPVENGKTFTTEKQVMQAYKEFLARWTECEAERNENGEIVEFTEVGNDLAPPPPPNPDAITCNEKIAKDFGTW